MAYTPNADDLARPVLSDPPISAPAEFRALKQKIKDVNDAKVSKVFPTARGYPAGEGNLSVSGPVVVDLEDGTYHRYNLAGNASFSLTHPTVGNTDIPFVILRITNPAAYTISFSTTVHWELGIFPTFTEGGTDLIVLCKPTPNSTFWEGKLAMRDIKSV